MTVTDIPKHPSVLIVEDENSIRRLLHLSLGDDIYHITDARDGSEALRLLPLAHPTIVILDLDLGTPGQDGFDLCRILRQRRDLDGLEVLLLTAHDSPAIRSQAGSLGIKTFFTKPFSPKALREEVDRLHDHAPLSEVGPQRTSPLPRLHVGLQRVVAWDTVSRSNE